MEALIMHASVDTDHLQACKKMNVFLRVGADWQEAGQLPPGSIFHGRLALQGEAGYLHVSMT